MNVLSVIMSGIFFVCMLGYCIRMKMGVSAAALFMLFVLLFLVVTALPFSCLPLTVHPTD